MVGEAVRVIISFFVALVIFAFTAWLIGPERKRKWFKKRDHSKSFFNRRGMLGEYLHYGHPVTVQGYVLLVLLLAIVTGVGYYIVFVW